MKLSDNKDVYSWEDIRFLVTVLQTMEFRKVNTMRNKAGHQFELRGRANCFLLYTIVEKHLLRG